MTNEQIIENLWNCRNCMNLIGDECIGDGDCFIAKQRAISAIRKQIPKKIIHNPNGGRDADWLCPSCRRFCSPYAKFCQSCGQAVKRGEDNG